MSGSGYKWPAARHTESLWRTRNRVHLLENGEEFFASAFAAIARAQHEILIETFILFEDKVGLELHRLLVEAAQRGVRVEVTVDGYGSPGFSPEFLGALTTVGVHFRVFDPHHRLFGVRLHVFRRLHRKLLVIDGELAFVGGINFSADHLADFGPGAKQDYAIEVEGPIVADIRSFALAAIASDGTGESWQHPWQAAEASRAGGADALFLLRDNGRRQNAIEREYRDAILAARREVVIANAYFFPGYGFLHELRDAARRGVTVRLICQGEPDSQLASSAARSLYWHLLEAGVRIHEYCERPFHGKVAVVDDVWSTVGSSNLDPLSLSLNLEANVFVRDAAFARHLRERLDELQQRHCRPVDPAGIPRRRLWHKLTQPVVFHCVRHFPDWAGLLPAHTPKVALVQPPAGASTGEPP
ncbi:cardiolipin synthase ClsB [Lysobacter sp. CFH 32150]|uniref:cardiolipin synthase ClsB n=1 Tax=Lysobacter sp. CFH 32150 TaxID=2927128 RepID=UPI001FA79033|nr:cardiolipin synthase ClsB [Lysobacter sp. CFH 32150]MCI4567230.1 cardiolipin synthase ClsB [Lysobacter sp. CFH 32150]